MAIQFSCDRCKTPVERRSFETADLPDGVKVYGQFHLCNNCSHKLKSWIEEPHLWHRSEEE